jgi:hypothetical protein
VHCGKEKGKKLFTCWPKWHSSNDNDPNFVVDTQSGRKEKGPFAMGADVRTYMNILVGFMVATLRINILVGLKGKKNHTVVANVRRYMNIC